MVWITITLTAWLSGSIWVVIGTIICLTWLPFLKHNTERVCFYMFLIPVVPSYMVELFGSGAFGANLLFELDYPRILILVILTPIFINLLLFKRNNILIQNSLDLCVFGYLLLTALLEFRSDSLTVALRQQFLLFVDVFIPYYVISRYFHAPQNIRPIFWVISFSGVIVATIGIIELISNYVLYSGLVFYLDMIPTRKFFPQYRWDLLRIWGSMNGPLVFGFVLVLSVAATTYLYRRAAHLRIYALSGLAVLMVALFLTTSRGAWLGVLTFYLVLFYFHLEQPKYRLTLMFFGLALIVLGWLWFDRLIYSIDSTGTFQFRLNLLKSSFQIISQNPLFGTSKLLDVQGIEVARSGGIIDIVNTYLQILIKGGITSFLLFVCILSAAIVGTVRQSRLFKRNHRQEEALIGRYLIAIMISIALIIFTTSSIPVIPTYYWIFIAICSAYIGRKKIRT